MRLPFRLSQLFTVGVLLAGSTALGYYYYFRYSPPLEAASAFMDAMEAKDPAAIRRSIVISLGLDSGDLREPEEDEVQQLTREMFQRGRILDQRRREGRSREFFYLVYREPDGRVYALVVTSHEGRYKVVIPETPMSRRHRYLWDYTWTN